MINVQRTEVIDFPSVDEALMARDEATRRLHWHLVRAAAIVGQDLYLGQQFDYEMAMVARARFDWHFAQDARDGLQQRKPTP